MRRTVLLLIAWLAIPAQTDPPRLKTPTLVLMLPYPTIPAARTSKVRDDSIASCRKQGKDNTEERFIRCIKEYLRIHGFEALTPEEAEKAGYGPAI